MTQSQRTDGSKKGDVIVRGPRPTDAIGHALRGAYDCDALPADMREALHDIDRRSSRH